MIVVEYNPLNKKGIPDINKLNEVIVFLLLKYQLKNVEEILNQNITIWQSSQ